MRLKAASETTAERNITPASLHDVRLDDARKPSDPTPLRRHPPCCTERAGRTRFAPGSRGATDRHFRGAWGALRRPPVQTLPFPTSGAGRAAVRIGARGVTRRANGEG